MSTFIHPISLVKITQEFGVSPTVYKRFGLAGHNGIDYRTTWPDSLDGKRPVLAPADMSITATQDEGETGYGRYVRGRGNGYEHVLGHLDRWIVKIGQTVRQGQVIGYSDNTGFSTGSHLHWGVRRYNNSGILDYGNGFMGYFDQAPLTGNAMDNTLRQQIFVVRKENGTDMVYVNVGSGSEGLYAYIRDADMLNFLQGITGIADINPDASLIKQRTGFDLDMGWLKTRGSTEILITKMQSSVDTLASDLSAARQSNADLLAENGQLKEKLLAAADHATVPGPIVPDNKTSIWQFIVGLFSRKK